MNEKPKLNPKIPEVPSNFSSREDAVAFGKSATKEQIEILRKKRKRIIQELVSTTDIDVKIRLITQAQFCREAIEEFEKENKTPSPR